MKKRILTAGLLALLMLLLAGCGKPVFGLVHNAETSLTVEAKNAQKDAFFTAGTLVVADGDLVTIAGELKKGEIRIELILAPEAQTIEEVPALDDVVVRADIHLTDSQSQTMAAGTYFVRVTCLESATGTVRIEAHPAE